MEKIIKSIKELPLTDKVASGSCSTVYRYSENKYLKLLNSDYRDLNEKENMEVLETLQALQKVKNTPSIAVPQEIFASANELYGYTSFIMPGKSLEDIDEGTDIEVLKDSIAGIKPEIRTLSKHHIKTEDIGGDNILFSDKLSLIDLELSLIDTTIPEEQLYIRTMTSILTAALITSFGENITGKIPSLAMYRLHKALKTGTSDDFAAYFTLAIYEIEHMSHQKIKTVKDSREAYQKVKIAL